MMLLVVILLALIFLALVSHPSIARNLPSVLGLVLGLALIGACLWLLIAGTVIFVAVYPDTSKRLITGAVEIVRRILVVGGPLALVLWIAFEARDRRRNGPMTQLAAKEQELAGR
jgi:hypothetical protein